jgi:DNA polymerase-3 subunit delta
MAPGRRRTAPPIVVIYGDDDYQKSTAITAALDALLPPEVDRSLALTEYDGSRPESQGGPRLAEVLEDVSTLPFLADCRVVLIREADGFITAHRQQLENYLTHPAPTGSLVLECRSFPKTTRLAKATAAVGGSLQECRKLRGRELVNYAVAQARERGKKIRPDAAARLVDLVGQEAGMLSAEVEKLALYAGERETITERDVAELVGQSREEKIFAAMDAAGAGHLPEALRLYRQVLASDPAAVFKMVGGVSYKVRQWLSAHQMLAEGVRISSVAPRMMMWGREQELEAILKRLPPDLLHRLLAALADLDSQAKSGARSIETGIETILVQLATAGR